MKFIKALPLLLAGAILLTACNSEDTDTKAKDNEPAVQEETKKNETKTPIEDKVSSTLGTPVSFEGIEFTVPADAVETDLGVQPVPVIGYYLDTKTGANFNVLVETIGSSYSLDQYIEIATAQTGYDYSAKENYTANGIEWNMSISTIDTAQGAVQLDQRTFIHDGKAYIFSFGTSSDLYNNTIDKFNAVVESVEIK